MKYVNKFSFNSTQILPKPAALALNQLYGKARGVSLPVLITGDMNELTSKTKLLRKFRNLSHLRLDVIPGVEVDDCFTEEQVLKFYQHLKCIKYLKSFSFKDFSLMTSGSIIGMINNTLLTNRRTL
jgi:hypothetical protein